MIVPRRYSFGTGADGTYPIEIRHSKDDCWEIAQNPGEDVIHIEGGDMEEFMRVLTAFWLGEFGENDRPQ